MQKFRECSSNQTYHIQRIEMEWNEVIHINNIFSLVQHCIGRNQPTKQSFSFIDYLLHVCVRFRVRVSRYWAHARNILKIYWVNQRVIVILKAIIQNQPCPIKMVKEVLVASFPYHVSILFINPITIHHLRLLHSTKVKHLFPSFYLKYRCYRFAMEWGDSKEVDGRKESDEKKNSENWHTYWSNIHFVEMRAYKFIWCISLPLQIRCDALSINWEVFSCDSSREIWNWKLKIEMRAFHEGNSFSTLSRSLSLF